MGELRTLTKKMLGPEVEAGEIATGAVLSLSIGDLAISTAKIATDSVTTAKITDLNVTGAKIASATILSHSIGDGEVSTAKIANLTIAAGNLATDSVTTAKITDLNVTTAKIATAAITSALINDIPINTSLVNAIQPVNSKGNTFATIGSALTDLAGSGWVYVPTGTFNEALTISDDDVILFGAGWSSIIHESAESGDQITVSGNNCVVRDLQTFTTQAGGNAYNGIRITGADNHIKRVFVSQSDGDGILLGGNRGHLSDSKIINCDLVGVNNGGADGANTIVNNYINNCLQGINSNTLGDNSVIGGNIIDTTSDDGIFLNAASDNCVVIWNRITNWTNEAIDDDSGTSLVVTATDGDPLNDIT